MSVLRRRVLALDRRVRWLETEGALINIEAMFKVLEMKQEIADRIATDPVAAAKWVEAGYEIGLPPPRVKPRPPLPPPLPPPPPPRPPEPPREQPPTAAPPVAAAPPPAPAPRPPPESPAPTWQPYDPPEHMQIRPVRWRLRGAEDYLDDDDDPPEDDDSDPFADP